MSPKWLARVGGLITLGCRGTGATPTPPPPAATPPTLEVAPVPAGRAEPEPVVATNDTDASDAEASSIDASPPATTEACLRCCDAESRSCDRGCPDGDAGRGCLRRCGSRRVGCRSACKTAPTPCCAERGTGRSCR